MNKKKEPRNLNYFIFSKNKIIANRLEFENKEEKKNYTKKRKYSPQRKKENQVFTSYNKDKIKI